MQVRVRNVLILSICQAVGFSGAPLVLLVGGLVGNDLALSSSWVTLPVTAMILGTALFTIPAALTMKRIGRRRGFLLGSLVASLGAAYGISSGSFLLFSLATLLIGGNLAFVQQYRFAAAESVEKRHVGRAISFVLLGGVLAGYVGPQLATLSRDWWPSATYAGSFVALAALYAVTAVFLFFLKDTAPKEEAVVGAERPLGLVIRQPAYLTAVWYAVVGYAVMGFIMTATPVGMHVVDGFDLKDTKLVIQAHIIAMYLPSLFAGFVVSRLGARRLAMFGASTILIGVLVALQGHLLTNYLVALTALGIGWNFLFVGGTVLLTQSYYPRERFKAQAINDFAVFGIQALVTLSAGAIILHANWELLNLLTIPFLIFTLAVTLFISPQAVTQPDSV
jgi:MFS family permease